MTVAQLKKHLDDRLSRMERRDDKRFAVIDRRFNAIDGQFAAIDGRFTAIDGRFTAIDGRFTAIDGRFTAIDDRFSGVDARHESMSEKLDAILGFVKRTHDHTTQILDERERRLQTLERR